MAESIPVSEFALREAAEIRGAVVRVAFDTGDCWCRLVRVLAPSRKTGKILVVVDHTGIPRRVPLSNIRALNR